MGSLRDIFDAEKGKIRTAAADRLAEQTAFFDSKLLPTINAALGVIDADPSLKAAYSKIAGEDGDLLQREPGSQISPYWGIRIELADKKTAAALGSTVIKMTSSRPEVVYITGSDGKTTGYNTNTPSALQLLAENIVREAAYGKPWRKPVSSSIRRI